MFIMQILIPPLLGTNSFFCLYLGAVFEKLRFVSLPKTGLSDVGNARLFKGMENLSTISFFIY